MRGVERTGAWPAVGRAAELDAITAAVVRDEEPLVVLTGAAGVGKTVLLHRFADRLDSSRFAVLRAAATPAGREIPFAALGHLLPAPPEVPANLIGWARHALQTTVAGRWPVLCIDDVSELDEVSHSLVNSLVSSGSASVVVTVRSGEAGQDPVPLVVRDGVGRVVEVGPLTPGETEELLERSLGGHVHPVTRQRVWQLTEGNPLYVRGLVQAAVDDGSMVEVNGVFRWDGSLPLAPGLVGLVEGRVAGLTESERGVLDLVAFGEPVRLDVLGALDATAVLEHLEGRGLVTVDAGRSPPRARVVHPLYGEVVRAGCPELRHRRLVRLLADATEAVAPGDPDELLRLALWRLDSGTGTDPALFHRACRTAFAANAVPLAARFGWAALNAGGGADVAISLASVLNYCEQPAEAVAVLATGARAATTEAERVGIAVSQAYALQYGLGDVEAAARLLADTLEATESLALRDEVRLQQGQLTGLRGDAQTARTVLDLVAADPAAAPAVRAQALTLSALCWGLSGRYAAARTTLREVLAGSESWHEEVPFNEPKTVLVAFFVDLLAGRLGEDSERAIEDAWVRATDQWDWEFIAGMFSWVRGQAARLRGRLDTARTLCRESVAAPRTRGEGFGFFPAHLGELAHVCALLGDQDGAVEALAEAQRTRSAAMDMFNYWIDVAEPWVTACGGDLTGAVDQCLATAARARGSGMVAFEVIALHDAVRLGGRAGVADRLRRAASAAEGDYAGRCVDHAAALEAGDADGLAAVATGFADLGMTLLAAEAAAQAGAAYRRQGRARAADRQAARAWALAARCEGARTPALATVAAPGLTRREQEVAHLAATGLTSRAIAEQLVTSVRTVDNHLARVYAKLGVGDRRELPEVLAPPAPSAD